MTNTIYRDVELVPQTDPETATDATDTTVHAKPPNKGRNFITTALKTLILILATCAYLAGLYVLHYFGFYQKIRFWHDKIYDYYTITVFAICGAIIMLYILVAYFLNCSSILRSSSIPK